MSYPRPDELASKRQIERSENFNSNTGKLFKTAKNVGSLGLGVGLSSKILPFLSDYITPEIALKGISAVSPQIGSFLKKGLSKGLDLKEGLDYVKKQIQPKENQKEEQPEQKTNILEQYSPELFNFIKGEVDKGRPVLEAGAMANILDKFKPIIKKITEDHKTPFSSILQTIFGQDQGVNPEQENTQEQQRQQGLQQFNKKLQNAANVQKGMDNISSRRQFSPAVEQALAKIMSM